MIEYYAQIKLTHIVCVILSGGLFSLRGIYMLAGSGTANHWALRMLSYVIDTMLLAAALTLVAMLGQYPFVQSWLTVKVLLLIVYIVLGVFALRRGRTRTVRAVCFTAALAVYLFIVSVALTHHPLGVLHAIGR
jgi:uncharacterized membrane protein SirB2